jgi:hypothetical protein
MNINDALIEALRRELAGYVRRGLPERVKAVEAELARLGFPVGATPRGVVQTEPGSTPPMPAKRAVKPSKAPEPTPAPKTPAARKKAGK